MNLVRIVLVLTCSAFLLSFSYAQNTGAVDPGLSITHPPVSCSTCAGAIWANEANANAQDNNYTEVDLEPYLFCFQSTCYRSRYLYCSDFGFSVPANAQIQGIKVKTRAKCDQASSGIDSTVKLAINYFPVGANRASTAYWSTNASFTTYGDNVDMWSYNWTPADINDPSFGVFIKVYNSTGANIKMSIDHVTITVYYSLTTGGEFSQTASPNTLQANYSPGEDLIRVSGTTREASAELMVTNIVGQLVFSSSLASAGEISQAVSTAGLPEGIYFVSLAASDKLITRKVIVAR
ncbi:MAG: T9SS type A sorting domain-containing protein [Bacteroidota bacterium]